MIFIWLCSFTLLLKLQFLEGLDIGKQEGSPGSDVNYYGDAQKNSLLTEVGDVVRSTNPKLCTKAPKNSTCIPDDGALGPNNPCQLLDRVLCDPNYPYRHFDGKCNNQGTGRLGVSRTCFLRFTAPSYDGTDGFRKAMSGAPLPEPRLISLKIFKNYKRLDRKITFTFVVFGQMMAHDLVRVVHPYKTNCCAPENENKSECKPIKISPDDPFYSQYNKTCMEFHRSEQCTYCKQVLRSQMNGATAAMDASWLYGENDEKAKELRAFNGKGELKHEPRGNLPIAGKDKEDEFCLPEQESKCILNGDPRVNMHASLTSSMAIWMREHNRIAKRLRQMHSDWEEEKLFQEARRIVIAEFQCIAFQYFLPEILSVRVAKEFHTYIQNDSDATKYDGTIPFDAWNEFAVAAFRLHSIVPSDIGSDNFRFNDTFSNPDLVRRGITNLLQDSFHAPAERYDNLLIDDITKYLYKELKDLVSLDIQRGRDHGLSPYVDAVSFCSSGTVDVESFDDLWKKDLMTKRNARLLKGTYENVRDIDMWVGMQMENHMNGSLLGPTAVCIIAKQTYFTMYGDRFFFNHKGETPSFTEDQRTELLKKCSLARVMCDNSKITEITKNPFFLPSDQNPEVSCEEIPEINLTLWKNSGNYRKSKTPEMPLTEPSISSLPTVLPL